VNRRIFRARQRDEAGLRSLFGWAVLFGLGLVVPAAADGASRGCATFGGLAVKGCQSFPAWTSGPWQPPAGATALHVLVVGGGGGGSGSAGLGVGGSGGASGRVITATVPVTGKPIIIQVGAGGMGGTGYSMGGGDGGASTFGGLVAAGGGGGKPDEGGSANDGAGGSSGGGGGGGGGYAFGTQGGAGGDGGTAGAPGRPGQAGTDQPVGVPGSHPGLGTAFPGFGFAMVRVTAGGGGHGGTGGDGGSGCAGGGGGGGGGVLINGAGGHAAPGHGGPPDAFCVEHGMGWGQRLNLPQGQLLDDQLPETTQDARVWLADASFTYGVSGGGGAGLGAGGGGGANIGIGNPGGAGAAGIVYVEWTSDMLLTQRARTAPPPA
jgi:hypothetical protein